MTEEPQTPDPGKPGFNIDLTEARRWLRSPVTLTLERWIPVAAGAAAVALVLIALD